MKKTDEAPTKRKISPTLIKYVRDRAPREVHNDDIAEALDLTREQVRNSLRTVVKVHPEQGIVEPSPYVYTYAKPSTDPVVTTNYAIPAVNVTRGVMAYPTSQTETCDFTVVTRTKDVIILCDTEDESLWAARRI